METCVVAITGCDIDTQNAKKNKILQKSVENSKQEICDNLIKVSKGACSPDIPIFAFGDNNFEESLYDIIVKRLKDDKGPFYFPFMCNQISLPKMDAQWRELQKTYENLKKIGQQLAQFEY